MHHPIPGDNVTVNSLKLLKKYTSENVSSIFLMLFFTLNKLIEMSYFQFCQFKWKQLCVHLVLALEFIRSETSH